MIDEADDRLALIRDRLDDLGAGIPATVGSLVQAAAAITGMSAERIIGKERTADVVWIRHAISLVASEGTKSIAAIGRALGGRDRTTILNGVEKAKAVEEGGGDRAFAALCAMLREHMERLAEASSNADPS